MPEEQDDSDKTEEPTHKRLQEAIEKGQVISSREITTFLMFVVLAINIIWLAPLYIGKAINVMDKFITNPHEIKLDEGNLFNVMKDAIIDITLIMALPVSATLFVALFSSFIQHGIVISSESIAPKLSKISVLSGIKRLFSLRSVVEFLKGIIKITTLGVVCYMAVAPEIPRLQNLAEYEVESLMKILAAISFKMILGACIVMFIIAMFDYLYQRYEYMKSLRMSRQELKEEFKQSEGDPQIKAKLRQIRMEKAKKRMMAAVPEADVVIRNPDHFAVALKYDQLTMKAPVLVAKGQDKVALKIIEIAEDNDIPLVRNPPLARALFKSTELEEEIPLEHYKAVAEVISYVYKLKGKFKKQTI